MQHAYLIGLAYSLKAAVLICEQLSYKDWNNTFAWCFFMICSVVSDSLHACANRYICYNGMAIFPQNHLSDP